MTLDLQDELRIERACARLAADYAFLADAKRLDDWSRLFAEDAVFELNGQRHQGRAAIRASLGDGTQGIVTLHANANHRIDVVSADEARGELSVVVYVAPAKDGIGQAAELGPTIIGAYKDVYRRTAEGWRIAARSFAPSFVKPPA